MKKQDLYFKIERIDDTNKLKELKGKWNALLKENDTKTVELTYEWQLTYWKYFHNNSKLFVLVVREGDDIIGLAPMKLTNINKFGIRARCLEFIAGKESNYQDFIIGDNKERVLQCIFQYLLNNKNYWDILRVVNIPRNSRTADFFDRKLGRRFLCRVEDIQKCIFLNIDKTWEEYSLEVRKKKRKYVQRCNRRLRREGQIELYHCATENEFCSNMKKLFELHQKHWNQTETQSQFNDKRFCEFYLEAVQKLLPKREIDLWILELEKSVISLLLSFIYEKNYTLQVTAYDIDYKALSPSVVMWDLFIKDAFNNDIRMIDFGTYYPFKELWGNRLKDKISFEIYSRKMFRCYYFYFLGKVHSFLRSNLKKNRTLSNFIRYIRQKTIFKRN